MPQVWRTVRIFISSTFRDMHAERDHLVRFVFPELRERCAKRRLHLVDVDLRWGVTEEEAERGKVLEVCLDEIERCRPFFVGLLGERYGWVPPHYAVADESRYDWVREFEPGHSITALEIYHGVLRNPEMTSRAFFYFRDPRFVETVPESEQSRYLPESVESAERLTRLKAEIRKRCRVAEYARPNEAFGQQMLEDLWSAIQQDYPEEEKPPDNLSVERAYHEAFVENRCRRFIGRRDLLQKLTEHADGASSTPLVVTGSPGCGKSALLARFARQYAEAHGEAFVLSHFIGVSPGSASIRRTLLRFCRESALRFGINDEIPEEYEKLRQAFPKSLEQAAASGTSVVLLLDALDQLDDTHRAHSLDWLPHTFPGRTRVIVSTLEGECLEALRRRRPAPEELVVGEMEEASRETIVRQTLWDYRKQLSAQQIRLLLDKTQSANPLFLAVACEELRVFGEFERVTERISSLPDEVAPLFEQVMARLEADHGKELVRTSLSLLACSRHGLLETELLESLRREAEEQLPRAIWARLFRSLQAYLRPPGETGAGLLDFFHRALAEATRRRYFASEEEQRAGHRRLAGYFQHKADPAGDGTWTGNYPRGLGELPYQQAKAGMRAELKKTLLDLRWMRAKIEAAGVQDVVADYDLAPGDREAVLVRDALRLSAHLLVWSPEQLPGQLVGRLLGAPELADGLARRAQGAWLRPLTPSLAQVGGPLLKTLVDSREVNSVAVTADGKVVSGSSDNAVKVWDLARGELLKTLKGHSDRVTSVAVTADGKVVSGSGDKTVKVWDLAGGELLKTLKGHSGEVNSVAVTADGNLVSGSDDQTVKLWDLARGELLKTLEGHSSYVTSVAVTADGKVVSGSGDKTVKVWDLARGELLKALKGHSDRVTSVAVTADGKVVSGSDDKTVKVWDLGSGKLLRTLEGHSSSVTSVAVTADGKLVSGSLDATVNVWDLGTCSFVTHLYLDAGILYCACAPGGSHIVAGDEAGGLHFLRLEGRWSQTPQ